MHLRFTIGKKIFAGFLVLITLTFMVFALTYDTLRNSEKINEEITSIYGPSVNVLENLNRLVDNSKLLITKWVYFQSSDDNPDKERLRDLIKTDYPATKKEIQQLAIHWSKDEQEQIDWIFKKIESLFILLEDIMSQLNSFDSYEDALVVFFIRPEVEVGGNIDVQTNDILNNLSDIIASQYEKTNQRSNNMKDSFKSLSVAVTLGGGTLLIIGFLIAFFTAQTIVKPVQKLKKLLLLLGRGIIPKDKIKPRGDEIGDMSLALNDLVDGFERTTEFAREVGSGNFESEYQPLSKDDTLGYELLKMREDLHESERKLEQKVKERTEEVVKQKEEIERKNNEITASIRYAKRIQEGILPDNSVVNAVLKEHFILYKPKDIVSGDFYWVAQKDGKSLFAAVDCTGHGVPGAFMSIIGNDLLKQIVNEHRKIIPSEILNELNILAGETIKQTFEQAVIKDGMDVAFCSMDFANKKLQYSGAYNPLYIIRKSSVKSPVKSGDIRKTANGYNLIEVKGNKFPIGVFEGNHADSFTNHEIQLQKGDAIYIFSDGYADQFGGERGKKYMSKRFRDQLLDIQKLSMKEQKEHLDKTIESWRGNLDQVDDIIVIGVKI